MKSPKQILKDEKAPLLALLWLLERTYQDKCHAWEPASMRMQLKDDFDVEVSELQSDRIQQAIVALTTDQVMETIKGFETFCHLANGVHDSLEELNPLEAEELISGVTELYLLRSEPLEFSDYVRVYAGRIFHDYGFHHAPELFPTAIMPGKKVGDDTEKNAALRELFDHQVQRIQNYVMDCIR